jgi:hypothetical protein
MTTPRGAIALTVVLMWLASASPANADPEFKNLASGACSVTLVGLPDSTPTANLRLLRDEAETTPLPRVRRQAGSLVVEFKLTDPLYLNSELTAALGSGPSQIIVAHGRVEQVGQARDSCQPFDERGLFEPTFLYGVASDTFAPNELAQYPPGTDYSRKNSQVLRLEAQLRLFGQRGSWSDGLWLQAEALYGVRSADLDCAGADKQSALCTGNAFGLPQNVAQQFTSNVLRASRVEAIFKPRLELYTLNADSSMPVTLFVTGRFGFTQFPGDVKPSNAVAGGGGFLFPAGPFRDSSFTIVQGRDGAYRSNPHANRTRMDFKFLFSPFAKLTDQLPFIPNKGQGVRGLVEVIVDRNFFGSGPDSLQTHLGVVIDFRQLLQ